MTLALFDPTRCAEAPVPLLLNVVGFLAVGIVAGLCIYIVSVLITRKP
jgi:hypothetical protein